MKMKIKNDFLKEIALMLRGFWPKEKMTDFQKSLRFDVKKEKLTVSCSTESVIFVASCSAESGNFEAEVEGSFALDGAHFVSSVAEFPKREWDEVYIKQSYDKKEKINVDVVVFCVPGPLGFNELGVERLSRHELKVEKLEELLCVSRESFLKGASKATVVGQKRDKKRKEYLGYGVKLECFEKRVRLVSTEGNRLVIVEVPLKEKIVESSSLLGGKSLEQGLTCDPVLLEAGVVAFGRMAGAEELYIGAVADHRGVKYFSLSGKSGGMDVLLLSPYSGLRFPDYGSLVDFKGEGTLVFDRRDLAEWVRRVGVLSDSVVVDFSSTCFGDIMRLVGVRTLFSTPEPVSVSEVYSKSFPWVSFLKNDVENVGLAVSFVSGILQSIESEYVRLKVSNNRSPLLFSSTGDGVVLRHDVALMPRIVEVGW